MGFVSAKSKNVYFFARKFTILVAPNRETYRTMRKPFHASPQNSHGRMKDNRACSSNEEKEYKEALMRFRAILSLAFPIITFSVVLGPLLSGCGSGNSTYNRTVATPNPVATPTPATPTTVKATIVWAPRSRQTVVSSVGIAALSSASSAVITVVGAANGGGDVVFSGNRPAGPAGISQTYTSTQTVTPGQYLLNVKFYNLPLLASGVADPTATLVATAQANAQILRDGTLSVTIATAGVIRSVKVMAGQTLLIGQSADVKYTAYGDPINGSAPVIPILPGVAQVSVANVDSTRPTSASVSNGMIQAVSPGTVIVTVTVDNVTNDITDPASIYTIVSNAVVTITPPATSIAVSGQTTFAAQVSGTSNQAVTWSLAPNSPAGAAIDPASGAFTAPNRSGDTYTVIATSQYDPTKTASATVAVTSTVTIVPTNGTTDVFVGANKSVALPVTIGGTTNLGVNYTVVGNTGTLTTNGSIASGNIYTAPNTEGNYSVVATSVADSSKSVTFVVHVGPSVSISPRSTTISVGQTISFFANVVGGSTNKVTYSVVGNTPDATPNGTIDANGKYTAPFTNGTYQVTATSVDDPNESDTATIKVQSGAGVINVN
jgi:hypothetical protein